MRKKKQYDDDDGRVIANMNVDGMPWYAPKPETPPDSGEKPELSRHETWALIWGVMKAALLVAAAFAAAYFLFLLILDLVW